jgi:hypothetical protein
MTQTPIDNISIFYSSSKTILVQQLNNAVMSMSQTKLHSLGQGSAQNDIVGAMIRLVCLALSPSPQSRDESAIFHSRKHNSSLMGHFNSPFPAIYTGRRSANSPVIQSHERTPSSSISISIYLCAASHDVSAFSFPPPRWSANPSALHCVRRT